MRRPVALVVMNDYAFTNGFDAGRLARLHDLTEIAQPVHTTTFDQGSHERLKHVEVLITGWGAPTIDASVLADAPRLRLVLHAAGSVKRLVDSACWDCGIVVTSAASANAVPVAEYTVAAVVCAGKRIVEAAHMYRSDPSHLPRLDGIVSNYQRTVGIVGYSRIGRRVVDMLQPFALDVLVADPYADADEVAATGARPVELDYLLTASDIVSLHAPELPETRHLLNAERLALVRNGATVINTARGSLIDTSALTTECSRGRLSAILDVTEPEPLPDTSPLWNLPNVLLTPHVAGAQTTEIGRLVDSVLDDLERYVNGEHLQHTVTPDDLSRVA